MEINRTELIETAAIIAILFALQWIFGFLLDKIARKFGIQRERKKILQKAVNITLYIIAIVSVLIVWSVARDNVFLFISSFLTVLGIAFVAQWSILSNITSSILLFVNHPVKIGDHLIIMDKDFPVDGYIHDIGLFFLIIKTDQDEKITIPTSLIFNKMIKIVEKEKP